MLRLIIEYQTALRLCKKGGIIMVILSSIIVTTFAIAVGSIALIALGAIKLREIIVKRKAEK